MIWRGLRISPCPEHHLPPIPNHEQQPHENQQRHPNGHVRKYNDVRPLKNPHQNQRGSDYCNQRRNLVEPRNKVKIYVLADDPQRQDHGQERQDLGINIGVENAASLKGKQVYIERDGKNPRNAGEVNQHGIQLLPGGEVPFAFAQQTRQQCRKRDDAKEKQHISRIVSDEGE